jgi:hypothetical protein
MSQNVSIFIRTYAKDAKEWLGYCLQSLVERAKGFVEIVVACPVNDKDAVLPVVARFPARLVLVNPVCQSGYIDQQHSKCCADLYISGEYIIHVDSDCVATREFTPEEFFSANGKPKLLVRPWSQAEGAICWRSPTKLVLGVEPPFETMATHPTIHRRETLQNFRSFIERRKGKTFAGYIGSLANFSEFNAIGNYAVIHELDNYSIVQCDYGKDGYPRPLRQFWSHGGITPEVAKEMDGIVSYEPENL